MAFIVNSGFNYRGNGLKVTATKNSTTDHDLKIIDTITWINGGELGYKNHVWGDYIEVQIIDIDNVLGGGANTVLDPFVKKRYLHSNSDYTSLILDYAGKIPKDTYLRVKYHSVGTTNNVDLFINYHLHAEG